MQIYKFKNVSGKNYMLSELGEENARGIKKGRKISSDPEAVFSCTEEEIYISPLLNHLISNGLIVQFVDDEYSDEEMLEKYSEEHQGDNEYVISLDKIKEDAPEPDPFSMKQQPRDILIDPQPPRNILVDEYQKSHIRSIYDDPEPQNQVKKK